MGQFAGLNLQHEDGSVADAESPDTSNTFFKDGKYGLLGARQGKTVSNRPAGNQRISGIFPFKPPWGQRRIVGTFDGFFYEDELSDRGQFAVGAYNYYPLTTSPLTATCTYNSTALSESSTTFFGGTTYSVQQTSMAKFYGTILTSSHNGSGNGTVSGTFSLGLIIGGVNTYLVSYTFTIDLKAGPNFTGPTFTESGASYQGLLAPIPTTTTGTASGVCIKCQVTSWPVLGGTADVQLSVAGLG